MTDTKLKPGRKKTGGRVKGTPNKSTVQLKQAILNAFDKVGREDYLVKVAEEDPRTFCTLLGKALPLTLAGEGEDGAITFKLIERKVVKT